MSQDRDAEARPKPRHERTLDEHLASGEPVSPVLAYLAEATGHQVRRPHLRPPQPPWQEPDSAD